MSDVAKMLVVSHSEWRSDPRVRRQVEAFRAEGWEVEGLFLDAPQREEGLRTWRFPLARRRGGTLRYLFEYGVFLLWSLVWISRRLLSGSIEVVYVNSPPEILVFAALPARLKKVPVVLDVHDPMPELLVAKGRRSGLLWRALVMQERWSLRFADRIITVHEPLRDLLLSRSPGAAIEVVMNVPDTHGWEELERGGGSRTLVYTGTVAVRYGLDDVLEAVALVEDRIPGLRFRIVGEGEDRAVLERRASSLGIADRCEFLPRVPWEELRALLADAWAGINVPKPDALGSLSFSNKVVEWIALGLPVVAGKTPTLLRYFSPEGLVYVTPGSPEEIATALLELHRADPEEIRRRVDHARSALEGIAWPGQRRQLLGAVRRAMAGAG